MNLEKAKKILLQAIRQSEHYNFKFIPLDVKEAIKDIISESHLTYRYILFTSILAKIADSNIHMRALQAGADLKGAYDARSLCHKVIVPIEKEELQGRLGNSNEPFLNKPARFTTIDLSNPVRKGNDKRILESLYHLLNKLNGENSKILYEALIFAIHVTMEREERIGFEIQIPKRNFTYLKTLSIANKILDASYEGQGSVVIAGSIIKILFLKDHVLVHPANQSGASSKEIGDIEIHKENGVKIAIEIKDKQYHESDVAHALGKLTSGNAYKLLFMEGPSANTSIDRISVVKKYEKKGYDLSFINIQYFSQYMLALFSEEKRKLFLEAIFSVMLEMRAKDELFEKYKQLINE